MTTRHDHLLGVVDQSQPGTLPVGHPAATFAQQLESLKASGKCMVCLGQMGRVAYPDPWCAPVWEDCSHCNGTGREPNRTSRQPQEGA